MKKSKFTEERMADPLGQCGTPANRHLQLGTSEATFYVWKERLPPGAQRSARLRALVC